MIAELLEKQKEFFLHAGDEEFDIYAVEEIDRRTLGDCEHYRVEPFKNLRRSISHVKDTIEDEFPPVAKLLREFPLILAGGAIAAISGGEDHINDFDLFIVNPIGDLSSMVDSVITSVENSGALSSAHYNGYTISLIVKNGEQENGWKKYIKIQIILRVYKSISQVLHGFDLGSSCAAFDGKNVYLTGLGKFAYEYGYNIVSMDMRSTTYETRLRKYWLRGFGIIMPHFKLNEIYSAESIDINLEFMQFESCTMHGKKIECNHINLCKNAPKSDYGADLSKKKFIAAIVNCDVDALAYGYRSSECGFDRSLWRVKKPLNKCKERFIGQNVEGMKFATERYIRDFFAASVEKVESHAIVNLINNGYRFNIADPTTQHFAMVNPAEITEAEWYGAQY